MKKPKASPSVFGWAGWIRTSGMQESKSCALPLGDSPAVYRKKAEAFFFLNGVDSGIRTHGLQSHNLTR